MVSDRTAADSEPLEALGHLQPSIDQYVVCEHEPEHRLRRRNGLGLDMAEPAVSLVDGGERCVRSCPTGRSAVFAATADERSTPRDGGAPAL
ncbi:hypothetical protein [Planosporangium mesophilum]|uniref:hypothetical protein n=1 Tax=Planosporangium mesophilum TaxID=689768 RepID=UPI0014388A52|nr:hypothetical protein [Planosporangium mesophilum]NJC83232.1 hypothetical protein [Planosporangium mesophilum]